MASDVTQRSGARSAASRATILTAAADRLVSRGYAHLTMEGVAADAKVSKQTIYRWWPSRSALVADCLLEGLLIPPHLAPRDSGDLRRDVTEWIAGIIGFLDTPHNAGLLRSLVVAAADNAQVALRLNERLGLWDVLGDRFTTAMASGQIPASTPLTELGEALIGALVVRDLRRGDFPDDYAERLVAAVFGDHPPTTPG